MFAVHEHYEYYAANNIPSPIFLQIVRIFLEYLKYDMKTF